MSCGSRLDGNPPATRRGDWSHQLPGLVVLASFLTLGLVLWVLIVAPSGGGNGSSERFPLREKQAQGGNPENGGGSDGELPTDHPPVEIPAEVQRFLANLEKQAAESPEDVEVWENVAQVQYRAGQINPEYLVKAKASYEHVLEIDEENPAALRGLGNIHFDRNEYEKAMERYGQFLELEPGNPHVRTDLGTMYLYNGDLEGAIRQYQRVIDENPKFHQAYFNLAIARREQGRPEDALELFQKARGLAPDDRSRGQIDAVIEQLTGEAPPAPGPDGSSPKGFQARVETNLKQHSIVGPKLAGFEWPSETSGRVLLEEFPMDAMPDNVRTRFLEKVRGQVETALRETKAGATASLELVDAASGDVMETIRASR